MNISLPAIIDLTDEQIEFIQSSGLYKIEELNASQVINATPTLLSSVEGDRFDRARTISVNELSFKQPIMGSAFAKKAENAIIVKRNSIYAKAALRQHQSNLSDHSTDTANTGKVDSQDESAHVSKRVNSNVTDMTKGALVNKNNNKKAEKEQDNTSDAPSSKV